jgi:hypothetical protein
MYSELLIANYDTTEQARQFLQMTLWGNELDPKEILSERKIFYNG